MSTFTDEDTLSQSNFPAHTIQVVELGFTVEKKQSTTFLENFLRLEVLETEIEIDLRSFTLNILIKLYQRGNYLDRPLHIGRTEVERDISVLLGESQMGKMPRTLDFPRLIGKFPPLW